MALRRITTHKIQQMKRRGEPIPMVTAYDYTAARIVDAAGIPMILVGDSMGNVVLGYDSTIPVTVDDIVSASAAVVRGTTRPLIIADMPFLSYQIDAETARRLSEEATKTALDQQVERFRPVMTPAQLDLYRSQLEERMKGFTDQVGGQGNNE